MYKGWQQRGSIVSFSPPVSFAVLDLAHLALEFELDSFASVLLSFCLLSFLIRPWVAQAWSAFEGLLGSCHEVHALRRVDARRVGKCLNLPWVNWLTLQLMSQPSQKVHAFCISMFLRNILRRSTRSSTLRCCHWGPTPCRRRMAPQLCSFCTPKAACFKRRIVSSSTVMAKEVERPVAGMVQNDAAKIL